MPRLSNGIHMIFCYILLCTFAWYTIQDKDGTLFVSLDGNFRLCRRKNAGRRSVHDRPLHVDKVFCDQSSVDYFVKCSSKVGPELENTESNEVLLHKNTSPSSCIKYYDYRFSAMNSKQVTC